MKVLSKPLSSPGRTEKLPTPLMVRFLRSNVGSRSRGRARSSPMFYNLRSKKNVIENTQLEPSSPTVTCIGQVRVRRSKGKKRGGASVNRRRGWWWRRMRRSFSCRKVSLRLWNEKTLRKVCCIRWGLFFRSGYCKKVDASEDSFRVCNHRTSGKNGSFAADNCGNNNNRVPSGSGSSVGDDDFRGSCNNLENVLEISSKRALLDDEHSSCNSSPPKNALLLTRCRSAPYRSSSLAGKFWNSPSIETKGDDKKDDHEADQSDGKSEEFQNPSRADSEEDPRTSEESKESMENNSVRSKQHEFNSNSIHPLLLTRCKSEPARTGFRLIEP